MSHPVIILVGEFSVSTTKAGASEQSRACAANRHDRPANETAIFAG
jgi:hypothetical protein